MAFLKTRCTTQSSVMPEIDFPAVVVAHDAGAANLIAGWLADCRPADLRIVCAGAAAEIFTSLAGGHYWRSVEDALIGAATVLTGTSRVSTLEHDARRIARSHGVPSIAVVDHWVNYRERFERNGEVILPDTIWVGDEHAFRLAHQLFPDVTVQCQPNAYLARQVATIRALPHPFSSDTRILYVLEPFRATWGHSDMLGEFQALHYFLECLPNLRAAGVPEIRLRPHPLDPPGKYDAFVSSVRDYRLSMDDHGSLAQAIAWADWVVGGETYAMVVALHAGRRVLSSLPPWGPSCRLPFSDIERLAMIGERRS